MEPLLRQRTANRGRASIYAETPELRWAQHRAREDRAVGSRVVPLTGMGDLPFQRSCGAAGG